MKKEDKLMDAIGQIDEELIPDLEKVQENEGAEPAEKDTEHAVVKALPNKRKKNRRVMWLSVTAGVLAAAVLLWILYPYTFGKKNKEELSVTSSTPYYSPSNSTSPSDPSQSQEPTVDRTADTVVLQAHMMAEPKYLRGTADKSSGYQEGYTDYLKTILPVILGNQEKDNCVFSPLSLYIALGMTAEITDGNSREQILDVMHQPDIETVRSRINAIWRSNYWNDRIAKLILANSLWLNEDLTYNQDVLDTLASEYFAASFSGDPTTEEYSEAYRAWINQQTDYLMEKQLEDLNLDPSLVLSVVSTVNYEAKWAQEFMYEETGTFHAPSGDVSCNYLYNELLLEWQDIEDEKYVDSQVYYEGENFTSVILHTNANGEVRLILPNEGLSPEELLSDAGMYEYLSMERIPLPDGYNWMTDTNGIRLRMPQFDVTSKLNLTDGLMDLGVTDIFDGENADFSPLTSGPASVAAAEQDARVMVDKYGIKAVAATIVEVGMGGPSNFIDFTLDRPFLFVIVSESGMPIFFGIVNDPTA